MSAFAEEKVTSVHHWTDTLFSFTLTRSPSLRFVNGQFAMIGLMVDGRPLVRAYSMASPNWEEHLEFLSIKVPNGPLTSRLQHIQVGDTVLVGRKPTGTLVADHLRPGRNLYLFSTGTGLAPFMSLIRDPELYGRFERVVLTHTVRFNAELAYKDLITRELPENEYFGDLIRQQLVYYPTVTREPSTYTGRITDLVRNGKMVADLGLPDLDPAQDRAMICGGPDMLADMNTLLEERGFVEGSGHTPADYVIEKAFVDKSAPEPVRNVA
ncbi:ferredoxin--NADP reductase [Rhodospirillum centenum]|uniref:ferredoxin--NADP(+) reductase n=1 Tax=Rhodospirillum centenum (strain ATCC 51521 / SW) TaxID=414684 RepID=B6IP61_RHOCS|nr:ferredoxin--NADP reductase [Rhodospirillum centenum]ACI99563.1 ferredoxin--NADP reductase [Rhodospirillum centenum SW]